MLWEKRTTLLPDSSVGSFSHKRLVSLPESSSGALPESNSGELPDSSSGELPESSSGPVPRKEPHGQIG